MTGSTGGMFERMEKVLGNEPNDVFWRCAEDSPETIMITNVKGTLVYVNKSWQTVYGYTAEEALGQTPRLIRSGLQDSDTYARMWRDILDPQIGFWKGEIINKSKLGQEIPVLLTITPYRRDGEIRGYMGVAIDMRDKKAMEAKILQQDRLASIGLLASGIAHEIGTPLGVVRGRAELLKAKNQENESLAADLNIIISQIDRVSKLVTNLLNLSRGQSARGGLSHLKEVCDEAISLLERNFRQLGIHVQNDVPSSVAAKIQHGKLQQVIINFLVNAVHAISDEIKNGSSREHSISIKFFKNGTDGVVSISDTGCGIDRENLSKIFKPFFTTKAIGEGTGLGLSISYQIIDEVGGDISVQSRRGEGTTFLIKIPLA